MGSRNPQHLPDSSSSSASSGLTTLDCPVCYNSLLPPIFQCKNGHLACNACMKKLKSCPVCRVVLPKDKIRNLFVENAVESISLACPNTESGCQVTLKGGDLSKHVQDCPFRPVRVCPYLGFHECMGDLPLKEIVSHLKSAHDLQQVNIQDGRYIELMQTGFVEADDDCCASEWSPVILMSHGLPPLILKTTVILQCLFWTISAVHSDDKVEKLRVKIKLLVDQKEINSLTWKGAISKLKGNFEDPNQFSVPIRKMNRLDHWKLLVKISCPRKGKTERDTALMRMKPRPASFFPQNRTQELYHLNTRCNGCDEGIQGPRFVCSTCHDYDLCQFCYAANKIHVEKAHVFFVFPSTDATSALTRADITESWRGDSSLNELECHGCGEGVTGLRFICTECDAYDLCYKCYLERKVHSHHLFASTQSPVVDILSRNSALLQGRRISKRMRLAQVFDNELCSQDIHE